MGFEPTIPCEIPLFESGAFSLSATSPYLLRIDYLYTPRKQVSSFHGATRSSKPGLHQEVAG